MKKQARRNSRRPRLVQISFKVSPETAEQLNERALLVGVSRHCVARSLVDEFLFPSDTVPSSQVEPPPATAVLEIEERLKGIAERLNDLEAGFVQLHNRFTVQETRLVDAQQDFANGVFALLVQAGMSDEHAEAFVRNHLHLPPRSS